MTNALDLSRFPGLARRDLGLDVDISPRVADLASTFPLLFFMLATDTGPFSRRLDVLRRAELGKPLSEVAAAYQLPLCLRRIQPEACVAPLPWVRWSRRAAPLLANHIPESQLETANWLAAVFAAARACHEDFGLWMARQPQVLAGRPLDIRLLQPLALYAWHAGQAETALSCITVTPWSPKFSLDRATDETDAWLTRLQLLVQCGSYPIADTWLEPGQIGEFQFVPLVTWDGLRAERIAMRNCLHTYIDKLAAGACRLFAVKAGNRSVATLEITPNGVGGVAMTQLKGPGNGRVALEIKTAARQWFESQKGLGNSASRIALPRPDATSFATLLAPYRQAIGAGQHAPEINGGALKDALNQFRRHIAGANPASTALADNGRLRVPAIAAAQARPVAHMRVHGALRARLGEEVYRNWFAALAIEGCDAGIVRASVPVRFLRNWIQAHYIDDLRACCAQVWQRVDHIDLVHRPPGAIAVPHAADVPADARIGHGQSGG